MARFLAALQARSGRPPCLPLWNDRKRRQARGPAATLHELSLRFVEARPRTGRRTLMDFAQGRNWGIPSGSSPPVSDWAPADRGGEKAAMSRHQKLEPQAISRRGGYRFRPLAKSISGSKSVFWPDRKKLLPRRTACRVATLHLFGLQLARLRRASLVARLHGVQEIASSCANGAFEPACGGQVSPSRSNVES